MMALDIRTNNILQLDQHCERSVNNLLIEILYFKYRPVKKGKENLVIVAEIYTVLLYIETY